LIFRKLKQDY